jgi:hypothetical protein
MRKFALPLTLLTALLFSGCAPATPVEPTADVNAIRTSAANTVVAEFTLTAAFFTPTPALPNDTPTPSAPTETPTLVFAIDPTQAALGTPPALCDDYAWDRSTLDVTIPDGTPMSPGQEFVKTWRIRNTGICTWNTSYKAIFSYSSPPNVTMNAQPIPLDRLIAPGEEVEVSVQFTAPSTPGRYVGYWQMVNGQGIPFGKKDYILIVDIVVQ